MSSDPFIELLNRLQEESGIPHESEEATKQAVILPILSRLGWDRDNIREVVPEYRVENGRVDYCLRVDGKSLIFVEAKRSDQPLERHQEQLLEYSFREGVELAVLTNGIAWWLYLPLRTGSWEQRKFFTIDLAQQNPVAVADHFKAYLAKNPVSNGTATKNATRALEGRDRERLTTETLPVAWQQLLDEPDELLAELVAERVESLCGHQPTSDQVAKFLAQPSTEKPIAPAKTETQPGPDQPAARPTITGYTFGRPSRISLLGSIHTVSSWKEVLLTVSEEVAKKHPTEFDKVTQLKGRKRDYFSPDYRGMTRPEPIPGTEIYVETNLSANDIMKRCNQVLRLFGYDEAALAVEAK